MFIIDVFGETKRRPFVLSFFACEIKGFDIVAIEEDLIFLNYSVMVIDSHDSIIMRDRKDENFSIKLFFALYSFVEFDDLSYDKSYTVSILSICNIESYNVALYLARQKQEVHSPRNYKVESIAIRYFANKEFKLFELLVRKCRSFESHEIIEL